MVVPREKKEIKKRVLDMESFVLTPACVLENNSYNKSKS